MLPSFLPGNSFPMATPTPATVMLCNTDKTILSYELSILILLAFLLYYHTHTDQNSLMTRPPISFRRAPVSTFVFYRKHTVSYAGCEIYLQTNWKLAEHIAKIELKVSLSRGQF